MICTHPSLGCTAGIALAATLIGIGSTPGAGQSPIVYRGARVRVSWTNPPRWLHGVVERAAGTDLRIAVESDPENSRIIIDDSTRLEVYGGRTTHGALGAGIGAVVGALLGGTVLSDPFGPDGTAFARTQGAFAGSVAGAGAGVLISFVALGRVRWDPIPIRNGRVVYPPLDPEDGEGGASLNGRHQWSRFNPHPAAFAAFFEEYWNQLDPIEGIFDRVGTASRIAIVRDPMFEGYRYVVVNIDPLARIGGPLIGTIVAAVRPLTDATYEVQFGNRPGTGPVRARLEGGALTLRERDGTVTRWTREVSAGDPISARIPGPRHR